MDVYNRGEYIGRYNTRDINIDGALIEITGSELAPHDLLELKLYIQGEAAEPIHLKGIVMHSSEDGVGILFSYGEHEFRKLEDLVHFHEKYMRVRRRHDIILH
jgi:hypothetical protein